MVVFEAGAFHTQRYLADVTFPACVFSSAIHVADPASLLGFGFAPRDNNRHERTPGGLPASLPGRMTDGLERGHNLAKAGLTTPAPE